MRVIEIVFVSRKYPPSTGGMQKFAYELHEQFRQMPGINVSEYVYGGSQKKLPAVYPQFAAGAVRKAVTDADAVYFSEGLMASMAPLINCTGTRTVATLHGLDITFSHPVYQYGVLPCIRTVDTAVCISEKTKELALRHGFEPDQVRVIRNGVDPDEFHREQADDAAVDAEKTTILMVGRLVERKGFHWFLQEVAS